MRTAPDTPALAHGKTSEVDRTTLVRCCDGDPVAFRVFVVRYQRPVFALLSRMLGNGPHVEDLAQETFLRAYRAFNRFDPDAGAKPSTWLLTIATRLALDERKRKPVLTEGMATSVPSTPERESERAELRRAIQAAISLLSAEQQAALVLSEFHGFSLADVADALEIPINTAKTRLFRARERLRLELTDYREDK